MRLAAIAAAWSLGAVAWAGPASDRVLWLQPLGPALEAADVDAVEQALTAIYALPVRRLPPEPLPKAAYYFPRKRYRAERLLDFLAPRLPADGWRILGLTGVDISTTKDRYPDWGVMGLANLDGPAGVISRFRCAKGAADAAHARTRLAKVAVHEIGHALGLEHCPARGCLMEDAAGKVATTDREVDLCAACRGRLRALGRSIPQAPRLPWARP